MTDDELVHLLRRAAAERRAQWERLRPNLAPAGRARPPRRLGRDRARGTVLSVAALAAAAVVVAVIAHVGRTARTPAPAMTAASAAVVQRHLAQSDSLIAAFRMAAADGLWDDSLTARARDLELATRRMQGGRIQADSALWGLFEDLDLVLTEIAGAGARGGDRGAESALIEYSLTVRQVAPRLRAAESVVAGQLLSHEGLLP